MTQSAVSQQLRHLERDAGSPLFIRSARGISLTEAGAVLLRRADAMSSELHMAAEEMASLADLRTGRVKLIAFPSAASTVVPIALEELRRSARSIEVRFIEAEPPEAEAAIRAGEADVAVVFEYESQALPDGSLVRQPLVVEPVYVVTPAEAGGRPTPLTADWLAEQPWIAGCPDCRSHLVECCRSVGFEPKVMHESDDYVVLQTLVAHGLGVSALPQLALTTFRHPGVAVHRYDAFGKRTVSLLHRAGADQVPATRALITHLRAGARAAMQTRMTSEEPTEAVVAPEP